MHLAPTAQSGPRELRRATQSRLDEVYACVLLMDRPLDLSRDEVESAHEVLLCGLRSDARNAGRRHANRKQRTRAQFGQSGVPTQHPDEN